MAFGWGRDLDDAAVHEGAEELPGAFAVLFFGRGGLVGVGDEMAHGAAAVVAAAEDLEEEAVRDLETGDEGFGWGGLEFFEGFLAPADEAIGRFLFDHFAELFGVASGFGFELGIFDDVFGSLGDDVADVIEAATAGAARDLVEIASGEEGDFLAAVFAEAGEEDGADGDVHADAEGIGAADDFEEAALGELLDENAVFGEEASVVDADAVGEIFFDVLAIGAGEFGALQGFFDGGFFSAGADVEAEQILGRLSGFILGEVDEVDGGFVGSDEFLEGGID